MTFESSSNSLSSFVEVRVIFTVENHNQNCGFDKNVSKSQLKPAVFVIYLISQGDAATRNTVN